MLFGLMAAGQAVAADLTVTIENIAVREGRIAVALYDSERTWMKDAREGRFADIDDNGTATVIFTQLPAGDYALSTYHDKNDNSKLDTRFKIPREPYAFSNNATGKFGPPKFAAAKFSVGDSDLSVHIRLSE